MQILIDGERKKQFDMFEKYMLMDDEGLSDDAPEEVKEAYESFNKWLDDLGMLEEQ